MAKTFISYRHSDGDWVWGRLKPLLEAAGVELLIDVERFAAGRAVVGQMDDLQDSAQRHLLVITEAYLDSDYCRHEMDRASAAASSPPAPAGQIAANDNATTKIQNSRNMRDSQREARRESNGGRFARASWPSVPSPGNLESDVMFGLERGGVWNFSTAAGKWIPSAHERAAKIKGRD